MIGHILRACAYIDGGGSDPFSGALVVGQAVERISGGVPVLMFPEERARPKTACARLNRGPSRIACRADVPVVPVLIRCTPPALGKGRPWYDIPRRTAQFTVTPMAPLWPRNFGRDSAMMTAACEKATVSRSASSRPSRRERAPLEVDENVMSDMETELKNLIVTHLMLEDVTAAEIDSDAPIFGDGLGLDSIDALELAARHQQSLWRENQSGRRAERRDLPLGADAGRVHLRKPPARGRPMTRDEIQARVSGLLAQRFSIDPARITPEARLFKTSISTASTPSIWPWSCRRGRDVACRKSL